MKMQKICAATDLPDESVSQDNSVSDSANLNSRKQLICKKKLNRVFFEQALIILQFFFLRVS